MLEDTRPSPVPPYTSSEFLDYVMTFDGEQVDAYKSLAGGIFRSSYTVQYCSDSQIFAMFVSIIDDFEKMTRSDFLAFHGDDARLWYLYASAIPKPENANSALIALCEESPDAPAELKRVLTGKRTKSRCAKCRKSLPRPKSPTPLILLCGGCSAEYVEGSAFYGILCGCGGSDPMTAAGSYDTLTEAMKCVRRLDKLGYECRLYKGMKPQNDAVELRLWIPLMRIFSAKRQRRIKPMPKP